MEHGVLLQAIKLRSDLLPAHAQANDGTDTQQHTIMFSHMHDNAEL